MAESMDKYEPTLVDSENSSTAGDFENAAFLNKHYAKEDKKRRSLVWLTFFNLFIFTISMLALTCAVVSQKTPSKYSAAKLMEQFGVFSPAMHIVEHSEATLRLSNPRNSSKYVGETDAVANEWKEIAYLPDQMVSMDDLTKLQKPTDSLRATDPRTGEKGYRVGLEVFHQLRCLDQLRMASYPDYYHGSRTQEDPAAIRARLDDCIETLRENLMCLSDVNVFTFHTAPGSKSALPDYESRRVCRNFDTIRQWAKDNAMPPIGM